jgi:hypothetical protein
MNKNTGTQSAITNGTPVPPPQVRTTPRDWGGPAEQQKTAERLVVARPRSGDVDDFCSGGPNSSSDDLRADAAARRPSPMPPTREARTGRRPKSWRSVRGWRRQARRRRNLFQLPWRKAPPGAAQRAGHATAAHAMNGRCPSPQSLREGAGRRPHRDRPQLGTFPSPALVMKILEAKGGAEVVARLAFPHHQAGGHRLG